MGVNLKSLREKLAFPRKSILKRASLIKFLIDGYMLCRKGTKNHYYKRSFEVEV